MKQKKKNFLYTISTLSLIGLLTLYTSKYSRKKMPTAVTVHEITFLSDGSLAYDSDLLQKLPYFQKNKIKIQFLPRFLKEGLTSKQLVEKLPALDIEMSDIIILNGGANDMSLRVSLYETLEHLEHLFKHLQKDGRILIYLGINAPSHLDNWSMALENLLNKYRVIHLPEVINVHEKNNKLTPELAMSEVAFSEKLNKLLNKVSL